MVLLDEICNPVGGDFVPIGIMPANIVATTTTAAEHGREDTLVVIT